MVLLLFGIAAVCLGVLIPAGEAWFERDWPRSTIARGL